MTWVTRQGSSCRWSQSNLSGNVVDEHLAIPDVVIEDCGGAMPGRHHDVPFRDPARPALVANPAPNECPENPCGSRLARWVRLLRISATAQSDSDAPRLPWRSMERNASPSLMPAVLYKPHKPQPGTWCS